MGKSIIFALTGILIASSMALANAPKKKVVKLFQVGKNGNYCVSTTREESGCISGVDDDGNTINVLDIIKGNDVVFENLSDAPHDMKITGANAEDMPAQAPNGSAAAKQMGVVDMTKQKITCSFHGDMLGVGYRVPDVAKEQTFHQGPGSGDDPQGQNPPPTPAQDIRRTGLADVGKEVVKRGRPAEVTKLVTNRPELMKDLEAARPLLAQEIAAGLPGKNVSSGGTIAVKGAPQGQGSMQNGSALVKSNVVASVNADGRGLVKTATGTVASGSSFDGGGSVYGGARTTETAKRYIYHDYENDKGEGVIERPSRGLASKQSLQTASLDGSNLDRTHLKVVYAKGRRATTPEPSNFWFYVALVLAAGILGRTLLVGARAKKENKK